MTTKRTHVPAALHAELTDYANLVRVLRTSRTLDLTTHLLNHAAQKGSENENEKDADTWTAWPLIDCPVPEWSLSDEIHHLGEFTLRQLTRVQHGELESTDHDGLDAADSDLESRPLVLHTASVLVHVLNLMADHRPSVPGSMQNRLWAMNWEDVVCVLAVGGVIDASIVARVQKRLERIYGPGAAKAVERHQRVASANARFSSLVAVHEDQLFAPPDLSRVRRRDAQGRPSYKSRAVTDTDTDTDVDA